MPLINCEINIFWTWPSRCIIVTRNYGGRVPKFQIPDRKAYVPVVTYQLKIMKNYCSY